MKILIIAMVVLSVGCTATKHNFIHKEADFTIKIVNELPYKNAENELAQTECKSDFTGCTIYIKESVYPRCITHEVRHVLEGRWHRGNTSSGCKVTN